MKVFGIGAAFTGALFGIAKLGNAMLGTLRAFRDLGDAGAGIANATASGAM
ncbi:MAG TPA: hypothetical protein VGL76_04225 [Gaiellaceae bacterium]|jgi:hypothetical protein